MKKILITGSTFWNSGDDLVRHGAMNIIRGAVALKYGVKERCSFFVHSFSHPGNTHSPLHEDLNLVYPWEVAGYARKCDLIVVPGLAVGKELLMFFDQIRAAKCEHKLIFIGGMNENDYCEEHASYPEMVEVFKRARVVIGRTEKHPASMDNCPGGYHCLPCPSIMGNAIPGDNYPSPPRGPVLFSIQLPHEHPQAVVNHSTGAGAALLTQDVMQAWETESGANDIRLVAHHKSEALVKFGVNVYPEFYSETEFLNEIYKQCRAVVSTRLHAVLRAESMGTPALLINDTARHTHAMEQYPHIKTTVNKQEALSWLRTTSDLSGTMARQRVMLKHRWIMVNKYLDILKEHV